MHVVKIRKSEYNNLIMSSDEDDHLLNEDTYHNYSPKQTNVTGYILYKSLIELVLETTYFSLLSMHRADSVDITNI